ncbi:MAG: hypothetical protein NPIRA05_00680 [Nitrospirales bacterium]|nr:MAG: hypothetical protein NPIRA05_00680 [Nitrospirales bacterium]
MNASRHARPIRHMLSLLISLGIMMLTSGTAPAAQSHEQVKTDMAQSAHISIEQAVQAAIKEEPGTVIKAELEKEHGPLMWKIEVVDADGKVKEVHIDGTSGKRLALHGRDETSHESESGIHAGSTDKENANMSEQKTKPSATGEIPTKKVHP